MIIEFGARNYFSFKEGFSLSLRNKNKDKISNILCVKGANASGKTSVLRVPSFLNYFCCDSFSTYKPDEKIYIEPFFGSEECTEFYITFEDKDGIEYTYELELSKHEVHKEVVYRKDKRNTKIIERINKEFTHLSKAYENLKIVKLRNNASFISTAKQYELDEIEIIYKLLSNFFTNVGHFGLKGEMLDINLASQIYFKNEKAFDFVKDIIKKADTGISSIVIMEEEINNELIYKPLFMHKVEGKNVLLEVNTQSSGVKSLYTQLALYWASLDAGAVLVLDEFDINLHPDLLPMLVQLFEDTTINKKGAQLIFTTHNTDIMDDLGKYRVALVNKEENESFLYRLDEIGGEILRNDRPISPIYKSGKIGGKPKIWQDLKIKKENHF